MRKDAYLDQALTAVRAEGILGVVLHSHAIVGRSGWAAVFILENDGSHRVVTVSHGIDGRLLVRRNLEI